MGWHTAIRPINRKKCKITKHFTCDVTLHVARTVNTKQLQHPIPWKQGSSQAYTGYGRKDSPIWEANKFETKKDMANFLFISRKYTECCFTQTCFEQNITQVAALNIDTLM